MFEYHKILLYTILIKYTARQVNNVSRCGKRNSKLIDWHDFISGRACSMYDRVCIQFICLPFTQRMHWYKDFVFTAMHSVLDNYLQIKVFWTCGFQSKNRHVSLSNSVTKIFFCIVIIVSERTRRMFISFSSIRKAPKAFKNMYYYLLKISQNFLICLLTLSNYSYSKLGLRSIHKNCTSFLLSYYFV